MRKLKKKMKYAFRDPYERIADILNLFWTNIDKPLKIELTSHSLQASICGLSGGSVSDLSPIIKSWNEDDCENILKTWERIDYELKLEVVDLF